MSAYDEKEKDSVTTKGYKVKTSTRDYMTNLYRESGFENEGDFLEHVGTIYEMQQAKTTSGYAKQLTHIEYHLKEVAQAFLGVIHSESAERSILEEKHTEKVTALSSEIGTQYEEIKGLKDEFKAAAEQQAKLVQDNVELRKYITNLEQINSKNDQLLAENKERIERLSKMVTDNTEEVEAAKDLRKQVEELTRQTEQQERQLQDSAEDLQALHEIKDEVIRKQSEDHTRELQRLLAEQERVNQQEKERADLAQEKAVLQVRQQLQNEREKENASHNEQVRKLYEELDKVRQQLTAGIQTKSEAAKVNNRPKQDKPGEEPTK